MSDSNAMIAKCVAGYLEAFDKNQDPSKLTIVSAPGRVNLIGEHTDYNDGYVFPMSIDYKTFVVGIKTNNLSQTNSNNNKFRFLSLNAKTFDDNEHDDEQKSHSAKKQKVSHSPATDQDKKQKEVPGLLELNLDQILAAPVVPRGHPSWDCYVRGVVAQYMKFHKLNTIPVFQCVIYGNVPIGAGLSSSASFEVSLATFLDALLNIQTNPTDKAKLCQQSDHLFCGIPCGLMDMLCSAASDFCPIMLDCRTLQYTKVPLGTDDLVFLVTNSNVKHSLGDGEYAKRKQQCDDAVKALAKHNSKITALRDATLQELIAIEDEIDEVIFSRAQHVILENQRVLDSIQCIKQCDYAGFGKLMVQSHISLKNDYEVSCFELDELVDIALGCGESVLGSRMTGGGFGGCTVSLVKKADVDAVTETIKREYTERTSKTCDVFVSQPAAGPKVHQQPASAAQ